MLRILFLQPEYIQQIEEIISCSLLFIEIALFAFFSINSSELIYMLVEHTSYSIHKNDPLLECFHMLYNAILKFLKLKQIFELLILAKYYKFWTLE